MKRDLDNQYQEWLEQIGAREINMLDEVQCRRMKLYFDDDIKVHRDRLEAELLVSSQLEINKREFRLLIEELKLFQVELNLNYENFLEYIERHQDELLEELYDSSDEEQQGLTAQRIQQFKQFQADESFFGEQCVICMGDVEINRNMMRLDCDGQHFFCQVCIEGWFATKKSCPICRHVFQ